VAGVSWTVAPLTFTKTKARVQGHLVSNSISVSDISLCICNTLLLGELAKQRKSD